MLYTRTHMADLRLCRLDALHLEPLLELLARDIPVARLVPDAHQVGYVLLADLRPNHDLERHVILPFCQLVVGLECLHVRLQSDHHVVPLLPVLLQVIDLVLFLDLHLAALVPQRGQPRLHF